MGWAVGYDPNWRRDIGYGVPSLCDLPGCPDGEIDRGLAYVCGRDPYGGEHGCGLFFHEHHLLSVPFWTATGARLDDVEEAGVQDDDTGEITWVTLCPRCADGEDPYEATPDLPRWQRHKVTHESWQAWRGDHPEETERLRLAVAP